MGNNVRRAVSVLEEYLEGGRHFEDVKESLSDVLPNKDFFTIDELIHYMLDKVVFVSGGIGVQDRVSSSTKKFFKMNFEAHEITDYMVVPNSEDVAMFVTDMGIFYRFWDRYYSKSSNIPIYIKAPIEKWAYKEILKDYGDVPSEDSAFDYILNKLSPKPIKGVYYKALDSWLNSVSFVDLLEWYMSSHIYGRCEFTGVDTYICLAGKVYQTDTNISTIIDIWGTDTKNLYRIICQDGRGLFLPGRNIWFRDNLNSEWKEIKDKDILRKIALS